MASEEEEVGVAVEKGKRKAESDISRRKKKKKKRNDNEGCEELQLSFFVEEFEAANGVQLSSLELESLKIKDSCKVLEVAEEADSDVRILGKNIKAAFGDSWREALCGGQNNVDAGSPAVLILTCSALRSIHLLKGFRPMTKECHALKLFSKHMKLQQQISLLKNRVNIASGTPSRIKKLIDSEALGLSRLQVLVLDLHPDVKGYSLFTLPQVRDEFWDLFKNYFYQPMIRGDLRICLYGYRVAIRLKGKHKQGRTVPDS